METEISLDTIQFQSGLGFDEDAHDRSLGSSHTMTTTTDWRGHTYYPFFTKFLSEVSVFTEKCQAVMCCSELYLWLKETDWFYIYLYALQNNLYFTLLMPR